MEVKTNEIIKEQQKPVGTLKPGMSKKQKIWVSLLAMLCLVFGGAVAYLTTAQVNQLKADGKNYSTLVPGAPGVNGKSAYQLAVDNGFQGSEEDWLKTLKGSTGDSGQPGLSAYQLAQVQGYLGTQQDWLRSLIGDRGKSAYEIAQDNGFKGSQLDWLASLIGAIGATGATGANGTNGAKGDTGDAGASAYTLAVMNGFDGTQQEWLASLKGADGAPGANGRTPFMSCVIRTTNSLPTQYIAWKYTDEEDSAYRDLYQLPAWAQGQNCVDLRSGV